MTLAQNAASKRPSRRATFVAPTTDLWTKYASIKPASKRAIAFIEGECLVPSGRGIGKPYKLLPFQKEVIRNILDHGAMTVVVSAPRGWGKSGLAAALLVWALYDREGAQVLACSTSMRTAQITYGRAVTMIERNTRLSEQAQIYRNAAQPWVEIPTRGATLQPLPAEEKHIVGFSPTFICVDEVGYVSHDTYEAMQTSLGKQPDTVLLGVGTPGLGTTEGTEPNLMWALREAVRGGTAPVTLRYVEYAADPSDDPGLPDTWRKANPALGVLVEEKAVAHDFATMPLSRFKQMRLGVWSQHDEAWLPMEEWDALDLDTTPLAPGTTITLGFDGSISNDGTALVAYEPAGGRLMVMGYWERPPGAKGWKVPRSAVMDVIHKAFSTYYVKAMWADPWHWQSELQELAKKYGEDRVVEFNTARAARMAPATNGLYQAVLSRSIHPDGSSALRSHMLAAVAKRTADGDVIVKDARRPQRIDLAVAAIIAHEAERLSPPRLQMVVP